MATVNPFQDIRMKAGDVDRSLNWYQVQIKNLKNVRPNQLMSNTPELTTTIMPGNMYMFFYDAKLKDRLKSYHEQKRQAKSQNVMSVYDNTNEPTKEIQEVQTAQEIAFKHIEDSFKQIQEMKSPVNDDEEIAEIHKYNLIDENVGVVKSKRGRPKKHQHPGPSETIAASV